MADKSRKDQCRTEVAAGRQFREEIPGVVDRLVHSCDGEKCFDHVGPEPIPSRDAVIDIVQRISRILYPGYFIRTGSNNSTSATTSGRRRRPSLNASRNK